MEKVSYKPRFKRLIKGVDFLPPLIELPKPAVEFAFVNDQLFIKEFDDVDCREYSLSRCISSGVIPQIVDARLSQSKLVSFDRIEDFYNNVLNSVENG